jgi:hypothetical protein
MANLMSPTSNQKYFGFLKLIMETFANKAACDLTSPTLYHTQQHDHEQRRNNNTTIYNTNNVTATNISRLRGSATEAWT